jgi:hypothetical protein
MEEGESGHEVEKQPHTMLFVQGDGLVLQMASNNDPDLPEYGKRTKERARDVADGREVTPFQCDQECGGDNCNRNQGCWTEAHHNRRERLKSGIRRLHDHDSDGTCWNAREKGYEVAWEAPRGTRMIKER